jgi:hypothetical protein
MLRHTSYLLFALLFINTHAVAATLAEITSIYGIQDYADTFTGFSGTFYGGESNEHIDPAGVLTDQTDYAHATYAMTDAGYVDLGFSNGVYNGPGADLIFFFFGGLNADKYTASNVFDLDIDIDGPLEMLQYSSGEGACIEYQTTACTSPSDQLITVTSPMDGEYTLTMQLVDLDDFGLAGNTEINSFRIYMENYPALSLVGAINTQAVPLPLPIVLFISGLSFLGIVGSRRKQTS